MFILSKNLENPTNLASFSKNLVSESCPRVHIAYPVRKYSPIGVLWESIIKKTLSEVGRSPQKRPLIPRTIKTSSQNREIELKYVVYNCSVPSRHHHIWAVGPFCWCVWGSVSLSVAPSTALASSTRKHIYS